MAEVLSRGRAGGHRREGVWLDRGIHQSEHREVPRPDCLPQHGRSDVLWRTRPEVPRVRGLPAEYRAPAAGRARRVDDAEPAAVSDRDVRGPPRGLRRGQLQPVVLPRELRHQLLDSGAEAIVVLENFARTLEKAIDGTAIRAVVVTGAGDQLGFPRGPIVNFVLRHIRRAIPAWRLPPAVRFNRALALGRLQAFTEPPVQPTDIAFLQYTGGTTGVPKGAMLTHRNLIANLRQVHAWVAPSVGSEREAFVTALPLYHVFSLLVNCFVPMMIGATNLLIANPRDIPALVKDLRRTPFTVITGVNTLFNALLNNEEFTRLDFSRLHLAVGGGMALQRAVAERWKCVTGKPLIEAYGLPVTD